MSVHTSFFFWPVKKSKSLPCLFVDQMTANEAVHHILSGEPHRQKYENSQEPWRILRNL